jgi:hypothetical protein
MEAEKITKLERAVWTLFSQNADLYDPLLLLDYQTEPRSKDSISYAPDAYLRLSWKGKEFNFNVEVVGNLYFEVKLAKIKKSINAEKTLIIVSFLSKNIAEIVSREGVNCIDLSGNYYIQTKDLLAIRLDKPDLYKTHSKIKKFYSENSSNLGRMILAGIKKRPPTSLEALQIELSSRGGSLSLSAISKVLSEMEKDQVILKADKEIKLLQPAKLLERLSEQYNKPSIAQIIKLNCPGDPIEWLNKNYSSMWVRTGMSSVEKYSVSVVDRIISAYVCEQPKNLGFEFKKPNLREYQNDRYYNLVINITSDSWVYFDCLDEGMDRWASQIQTYLELSQMDKREKEIAEIIKTAILVKYE